VDKIQINKIPQGKAMEFKPKDPIVIDETKEVVFGNDKLSKELEEMKEVKEFNRRWMESLSDCA
jgi:hypothetical protein